MVSRSGGAGATSGQANAMRHSTSLNRDAINALLRQSFLFFAARCFDDLNPGEPFISAPYLHLLAASLEAFAHGEKRRFILNLPPRSLKSHFASVALPAWILGNWPEAKIMCVSYGSELSEKLAADCRTIMKAPFYLDAFGEVLTPNQSIRELRTRRGGYRYTTSVGGPITGRGADFIIIDDPQKADEAQSETSREKVKEYFSNTLLSRLNDRDRGAILVVAQRLHQDDLTGYLLEGDSSWEILRLALIAEEAEAVVFSDCRGDHVFQREAGDLLNPNRDTQRGVDELRAEIGAYTFESQYQQNPQPKGGNIIKREWLRYYDPDRLPAKFDRIILSWDTASKAHELADYSVCTIWGQHGDNLYLLDVYRKQVPFPELRRIAELLYRRCKRWSFRPVTLIEDRSSGIALAQELQGLISGVKARPVPPGADKIVRIAAQSHWFERGLVFLPRAAAWLHEYEKELLGFPATKHDDQIDSTSQALAFCSEKKSAMSTWRNLARKHTEDMKRPEVQKFFRDLQRQNRGRKF